MAIALFALTAISFYNADFGDVRHRRCLTGASDIEQHSRQE